MSSSDTYWHNNQKRFKPESHALFGASKWNWINYDTDKMLQTYINNKAKKEGTELHEIAAMLINKKIKLPELQRTLNMYVNDGILLNLRTEEQLYYSEYFFGTADTIGVQDGVLRIHDLKTGVNKASMHQLEIYTALFMLEYNFIPKDFKDIELRIYQNDDIEIEHPTTEDIVPIMDKIITTTELINKAEEAVEWITM